MSQDTKGWILFVAFIIICLSIAIYASVAHP